MKLRCDLENFVDEYENDFNDYLQKNPYSNETYFLIELKEEYTRCLECYNFRLAYDLKSHKRNILLGSYLEYSNNKNQETTIFAKELKPKILVIIKHIETLILNNNENMKSDNIEVLDYSDVGAKEKIIALNELGIIDYLQKEFSICRASANKTAEVLSLLIGEKSGTIQSYINPMISKDTSQKNNPYNNIKTVEKTKNKLISIGVFKAK